MDRSDHDVVALPAIDTSNLQQIHSGLRHKLYRIRKPGTGVIVKLAAAELPASQAGASILHEYEMLRDVELPGVVKVRGLANTAEGLALLMADAGRSNLAELTHAGPMAVADFLEVAIQLAEAVAALHEARIVHRDINPHNVVWDAENRRATLCDFGIAATLSALTVEGAAPRQLEGTLAYISPEQTGRTGRGVDARTDLYSLGASFHEMLTGHLPFGASGPVELVHAHIARRVPAAPEGAPCAPGD